MNPHSIHRQPSRKIVLWEVDVQADFMLPEGKLYVPGAEKLLPNIRKLTDAARSGHAFLVSHGCFHAADDPEFADFPAHCVKGTPGAELMPEALADAVLRIPNEDGVAIPERLDLWQQVLMEKQTLDIFETRHVEELLKHFALDAEFAVFGVVTEICVVRAARGLLKRKRKVALVTDAIASLGPEGERAIAEMRELGARLTTTSAVLAEFEKG